MGAESESQVANNIAFQAMGKTYHANAAVTSQTITVTPDSPCNQLLVSSHESSSSSKAVYFVVSNDANVTVTAPTNGSPQYCLLAIPNTAIVYTIPGQFSPTKPMYIAFICEADGPECYFTPGEGL